MCFKKALLVAASLAVCMNANANNFSKILDPKGGTEKAAPNVKTDPVDPRSSDLPAWLKDSQKLKDMLGADANFRVQDPKVIRRLEAPFPGLEGYVVEATSFSDATPEGKKELFVFYTDTSKRYLMVGMMIDMERNRDVNLDVERFVRGELADNPAKALRPQDMHQIKVPGGTGTPIIFVVDLGKQEGRDSMANLVKLHQSLRLKGENIRPLHLVLVSAGHDEYATAAMALAYGDEAIKGTGLNRAMEFAERGRNASWLQPKSMNKSADTKRTLGTGIFKMEDNSTQAMLARINTLPLVYVGEKESTVNVPLPINAADWTALLKSK